MKIFSKEQIYEGDRLTAERQSITSTDLMERAGIQIFNWIHLRMQGAQVPIHVFCGIGNNGGDGLVVARHLITHGYNVNTYVVNCSDKRSKDFLVNYDRIKQTTKSWPIMLSCANDFPEIESRDIIIDAIFGIGLNRPIDGWIKDLFKRFKDSGAYTLAVDIPSGLFVDRIPKDENDVVKAHMTLSFQSPKLVFFLPETSKFSLQWEALDIGIDQKYLVETETDVHLIGKHEILVQYKPRDKFAHKGNFGHALLIGGSYGKMGAMTLSSKGTFASGAGLVTSYVTEDANIILQIAVPEAMVNTDTSSKEISNFPDLKTFTSVGVGMGLGTSEITAKGFSKWLEKMDKAVKIVFDADAINLLSKQKSLLQHLPNEAILTPHPKELQRLIGDWDNDFDKLNKVKAFSKEHNVIVVLKGAHTTIVFDNILYVNTSGNPGMATAGSGDVLTGVITGLLAQNYSPLIAAIMGVYLHGKAADLAIETHGYQSLIASHIIEYFGPAYLSLFEKEEQIQEEEQQQNQA
ncbi:MAG: carbohydrate kinase [Bacteroidetes bacterium MedPE-SWsnd-G2]|nr:MAG: carbohydrate kinase [Bacteroidetes bacterium MedPE-SWsnd-G2]